MGLKILLSIVWLSVCGLPRFGDCVPKWEKTDQNNKPYNGQKVYADRDSSFTFDWRFDNNGYSRQYTKWEFSRSGISGSKVVATKQGGETPVEFSPYKDRLIFGNGASLEIKKLKYPDDEGRYECDLTFSSGGNGASLDDVAELIVVVPPIITGKISGSTLTISEQETRTLKCSASGNPKPRIIWKRENLETKAITTVMDSYNHYGYNITYAQRKDIGLYTCEAIISVNGGKIFHKASYSLTVYVKYKPEVTYLTGNRTLTEGSNVELECKAKGDPQVIGYHWYRSSFHSSSKLSSGGKYTITTESNFEKSNLVIKNLDKSDADWYYCGAENSLGIGNASETYVAARFVDPSTTDISEDKMCNYFPPKITNFRTIIVRKPSDSFP